MALNETRAGAAATGDRRLVYAALPSIPAGTRIWHGLRRYCWEENKLWQVRHSNLHWDLAERLRLLPQVSGVLVFAGNARQDAEISALGLPAVNVSGALPNSNLPRVRVDEHLSGTLAARHLIEAGFEAIKPFLDADKFEFDRLRHQGMLDELAAHGKQGTLPNHRPEMADPSALFPDFDRPTAVVSSRAGFASELLSYLREWTSHSDGLSQHGVLCIDEPDTLFNWRIEVEPDLSYVKLPWERVGYEAGRVLASWIEQGEEPPSDQLIQGHEVVARSSTRTMRGAGLIATAVIEWLERNYDPRFGVEQVAESLGFSVSGICKNFRAAFAHPLGEELARRRHLYARRLLTESHLPVKAVAAQCGYGSASAFIAAFRKAEGETPSRWRQRQTATRGPGDR